MMMMMMMLMMMRLQLLHKKILLFFFSFLLLFNTGWFNCGGSMMMMIVSAKKIGQQQSKTKDNRSSGSSSNHQDEENQKTPKSSSSDFDESSNSNNNMNMMMTPSKPSFLFILIDDIGWSDFSYNNGTAKTPNIDAWTKKQGSVVLQDFHSGGTVCSPTRATVLTGRNHFRDCVDYVYACPDMRTCTPNFEFAPSQTYTIGDAVRSSNDYEDGSYFAGKWHLGSFYNDSEFYKGKTSSPITHGFDHMNATVEVAPTATLNCMCKSDWYDRCNFGHYHKPDCRGYNDCCYNYWWDDPMSAHGISNLTWPTPSDDSLYLVDAFTRFLNDRNHKPFLAQISFHNCHIPFIGSNETRESCIKGETCRLPEPDDGPYTDEELDYYSCMIELDNAVGLILDELTKQSYYDNTMIWFGSDNGPEQNCQPEGICQKADTKPYRPVEGPGSAGILRGRKRDIYEGGHRVAGIVSFPSVVPPIDTTTNTPIGTLSGAIESWETVVTMDFLPTVMEILGVDRPQHQQNWAMDGRSILSLLQNPYTFRWEDTKDGPREIGIGYYHAEIPKMIGWGFRYGRWKYVEGSASCSQPSCHKPQLYDLETDLGERHDLSLEYPEKLIELQHKFKDWHDSIMFSRRVESKCQKSHDLPLPNSLLSQRDQEEMMIDDIREE